jgi:antitoxin (DNA-binding transcriptional repressor) of toxin-antitoxin stability system
MYEHTSDMKTVSAAKFYADTALVDDLSQGDKLVVTSRGKAKFVVTKGNRPRMTRELAEQRSVGDASGPKFDSLKVIQSLKK